MRILSIAPDDIAAVRRERRDAWGNHDLTPVRADEPRSYPCRVCLRDAAVGDELLLFSHSPFPGPAPYRSLGPIFVHAGHCEPFVDDGAIPEQLTVRLLSIRAFSTERRIVGSDVVPGAELAATAARLLALPGAAELHVHFARNGCYACRIVRA